MESPKNNFQTAHKPANDPALQLGEAVVPGPAFDLPQPGIRPNVTSGDDDNDNAKGNIAEPAGNSDGKGNSASQPTPTSEPAKK